ncbi:MAG TPA: glycosyltransferase [Syntrophorhabdaceae bacterium]|jgi:rhamnosyltransferase
MVSVIIPTYNAMPAIERLISSLKTQTAACEIIVIDSSSSDETARAAESCGARVITVPKQSFNHGGTRNLAAMQSRGDITVFLTQDALPCDDRCIEHLIEPLRDPRIAASYGRQIPRGDAKPTEAFARNYNYPESGSLRCWDDVEELGIKAFFFSNVCSAIRGKEFQELGGFPDKLIMFEDMLYAANLLKSGYSIAYAPGARVVHSHDYSWAGQFGRYARAGLSFSCHPWLAPYARGRREGLRFLDEEIRHLLSKGMYFWGLYALGEAFFKYGGYYLGLRHGRVLKKVAKWTGRHLNA